jgi:predicted nucleotidyltransferase
MMVIITNNVKGVNMKELVVMEFGSHVYGTNIETSDRDYKGIYIPDRRDILLQRVKNTLHESNRPEGMSKNDNTCVDREVFSLQQFMKLLCDGQTVALNMIFTPDRHIIKTSNEWEWIKANKHEFIHRGVTAFAGYCRQQANKYGIKGSRMAAVRLAADYFGEGCDYGHSNVKLENYWDQIKTDLSGHEHIEFIVDRYDQEMLSVCNRKIQKSVTCSHAHKIFKRVLQEYGARALAAEKNVGIDWKALMHAVRVCSEATELLSTGIITYPRPERELLLSIRRGDLDYAYVAELIETGLETLERVSESSSLREEPNRKLAESFVAAAYSAEVIGS